MTRWLSQGACTAAALAGLLNAGGVRADDTPPPSALEPTPVPAPPPAPEPPPPSPAPPTAVLPAAVAPVQQVPPAPAVPSEAAINSAWGPRLVRVRVGKAAGRGVFFGSPKHVLTAYRLVNRDGELQVMLANGERTPARVVGWNAASGLALLELETAPAVNPAVLAARAPQIGDAVLSPDFIILAGAGTPAAPVAPVLGAGRVSGRLDETFWVDMPFAIADLGRPILAPDGALLGIVIGDDDAAPEDGSLLAWGTSRARVAGPGALAALAGQPHAPGTFEPESHASWSTLAGLLVVPLASDGVQGAALQFGYRYDWFVFLVREGFGMTGFAPRQSSQGSAFERIEQRFFFEAEVEAQFPIFTQSVLWAGAGGVYFADSILRREIDGSGNVLDAERTDRRVRPLFGVGLSAGFVEFSAHGYYDDGLKGRVGIGFLLGRQ